MRNISTSDQHLIMKLMDKYLLREYMVPVVYCMIAFPMVFVVYDLFDHLSKFIEAGTALVVTVRYYLCVLTSALEYFVPASLLLATLYTLWRLTRKNELTAMRASGVSLYRIMLPFLIVGLIFSITSAIIKETVAPMAQQWADDFSKNGYREPEHKFYPDRAFYNSTTRRLWLINKFDLKHPHHLEGVKVTQERGDNPKAVEIIAEKAEWLDGQWWFFNGRVQRYNANGSLDGEPESLSPLGAEMQALTEEPSSFVREVKPWEFLSTLEMIRYLNSHPDLSNQAIARKKFDLHSRLAMPWACFIVMLFGIPVGAKSGRQNLLAGIFLAMAFFFGFYALTQVGLFLGKTQIIWPWLGAWLSNMVFLVVGIGMVRRMR